MSSSLMSADLSFMSFDPYMFDRHGSGKNLGNMDMTDLDRLLQALDRLPGSVVLQLSTYGANNSNAQPDVRQAVAPRLEEGGLREVALVRANGNMVSLVFERQVEGAETLRPLPTRFETWSAGFQR